MRGFLLILLSLTLVSCSGTQLAYNRLDWLLSWQLSRYVDLHKSQREQLQARLAPLWQWHRQNELPKYADDLGRLAAALESGTFERSTLDEHQNLANRHFATIYEKVLPDATQLLTTLDDAQVDALQSRIQRDADKRYERYIKRGPDGWRAHSARNTERSLRRWIGRATPQQRERIDAWAQARVATPEQWLAYQRSWTAEFVALLKERKTETFPQRLQDLLEARETQRSETLVAAAQADREAWLQLMMDLHETLEPQQRERLVTQLRKLADDFTELATAS